MLIMSKPRKPRQLERAFWRQIRAGMGPEEAAVVVGVSKTLGRGWFNDGGGMPTIDLGEPSGRYLSMLEREEIAVGLAAKESLRGMARRLGRSPSTIKRELDRNCPRAGGYLQRTRYRATKAQSLADTRARRPKPRRALEHPPLRAHVQEKLLANWSPEQIAGSLPVLFPHDGRMRVSHEAIYQSIYVQGRGGLRRELAVCLRTGRALRKPQRRPQERRGRIKDMVNIADRPPEVDDRAIPGHWEGDLIIGRNGTSAIGTLVERTTRFVLLLHLSDHTAPTVREAIATTVQDLPPALRRTLTWDQGRELSEHVQLRLDTDMDVYFCDPHSPWQRGTNENTNGLLRQYFPKGTALSAHSPQHLRAVGDEVNGRPRKTLGWRTPAQAFAALLSDAQDHGVATTS
jgi:IS30 family transposase